MDMEKLEEVDRLFKEVKRLIAEKDMLTKMIMVLDSPEPYGGFELNTLSAPIYSKEDREYAFLDYQFELSEWNLKYIRGLMVVGLEDLNLNIEGIERTLYLMGVDI